MILVIGATGVTGRELVRRLVEKGARVRALVRHAERARHALGDGPELAMGNLLEPATLQPAMNGVDRIFLLSPGADRRQLDMQTNVIEAATRARVAHVVKLSAMGARRGSPVPMQDWHAQIEERLESSGLAFTILRPNYFMQNLVRGFASTIRSEGSVYAPAGQGRISMIDVGDVAEVAATILVDGGFRGERLDLSGPEAVSFQGVADQLSALLHRTVHYVDLPPEQARQAMLSNGVSEWLVEALLAYYQQCAANLYAELTPQVARVLGRPPRPLLDFLSGSLQHFQTGQIGA